MNVPAGMLQNGIEVFLLIFVRMTGLFVVAPVFGRRNIPTTMKIGFSLLLALILINTIKVPRVDYGDNIYGYAALMAKEFIVGILIGYVAYLIFTAIHLAGQIIDMQIGFGVVNVMDPLSNIQVSITSNFYFIITMLIFLLCNGHHILIKALFESYNVLPLGSAQFNEALLKDAMSLIGNIFFIAFKISSPVMVSILVVDVALGVLAKSVPQINVFVVGMPLKILLGIAVIMITMPIFVSLTGTLIQLMENHMFEFLKDMVPK